MSDTRDSQSAGGADENELRGRPDASDLRSLGRGSLLNLLGSVSSGVFGFALLLVLGRGLGAAGSGAFFEAVGLFSIVVVAATAGVDTGMVRWVSRTRALGDRVDMRRLLTVGLVPVAVLGAAAAAAGILGSDWLADSLGGGTHTQAMSSYIVMFALVIPVGALYAAVLGATRGFETMLPTVAIDKIAKPAVQTLATFGAVVLGLAASAIAAAWAVPIVIALVAGALWLAALERRGLSHPAPDPQPLGTLAREFWAFTLPRSLASLFQVGVQWFDVVLVGALMSPRAAGIYAVSTRILQFGFLAAESVGRATEPMFGRLLAADRHARVRDLYQTATGWVISMTWPQYLFIGIFAVPVLSMFGPGFDEGAVPVMILAVSALVGSAAGPVDILLLMAGKSTWSFWNTATALAVNVGLNLLLIPRLGLTGAAIAWAVSRVLANALPMFQIARYLGLHPFGSRWLKATGMSLASFGVVGAAVSVTLGSEPVPAIMAGVVATVAFLAIAWRFRGDLQFIALRRSISGDRGK